MLFWKSGEIKCSEAKRNKCISLKIQRSNLWIFLRVNTSSPHFLQISRRQNPKSVLPNTDSASKIHWKSENCQSPNPKSLRSNNCNEIWPGYCGIKQQMGFKQSSTGDQISAPRGRQGTITHWFSLLTQVKSHQSINLQLKLSCWIDKHNQQKSNDDDDDLAALNLKKTHVNKTGFLQSW